MFTHHIIRKKLRLSSITYSKHISYGLPTLLHIYATRVTKPCVLYDLSTSGTSSNTLHNIAGLLQVSDCYHSAREIKLRDLVNRQILKLSVRSTLQPSIRIYSVTIRLTHSLTPKEDESEKQKTQSVITHRQLQNSPQKIRKFILTSRIIIFQFINPSICISLLFTCTRYPTHTRTEPTFYYFNLFLLLHIYWYRQDCLTSF